MYDFHTHEKYKVADPLIHKWNLILKNISIKIEGASKRYFIASQW